MKIMIAIDKLVGGGAERVATLWANELHQIGYDVAILNYFPSDNEYARNTNIDVYRIADSREQYLRMAFIEKYTTIRKVLKKEKPNYIISFSPSMQVWVMLASIGLKMKRIETIRINPWKISIQSRTQYWLWKMCYCTCYKIILQSSDQAPFFSRRQQKKSVIIPNPISDIYEKNARNIIDDIPKKFIAAGRISEQKNYPLMIKAFANVCKRNPNISLRIYGTGDDDYVQKIRDLIATEGMTQNVFLMGRVNHMEQEYREYDVFLMTSDYEGLPNALVEAMASRLVCISTDCKTGPRDLIDEGINGFLVPVGESSILQQKIEDIFAMSPEQLDKVAGNAREKALTYCSCENSIARVCQLLV